MTDLVHKRSAGFFLAAWFLMAALFADGVNLDDLLPGTFVIHDSDDAVQSVLVSPRSPDRHASQPSPFQTRHLSQAAKSSSSRSVRIVFDEDSPSEAADPLGSGVVAITPVFDDQPVNPSEIAAAGPLHLLNCTLLI